MEPKTTESGTTESGTTGATPGVAPIASTPALAFEDFDDYGEEDENAPLTGSRGNLPKASSGPRSFWQLGYYQSFFNVETDDVLDRLRCALLAYKGQTIFDKNTDADLYGPFWITATVALTLFVVSNIAGFIHAWLQSADDEATPWLYDFSVLFSSFSTMLSYTIGASTVLWMMLRWRGQPCKLVDLVCIYGYAGTIWLPMTLLCIVPISWLRWLVVVLSFAYSSYFIFKNIQLHLQLPLQPDYAMPTDSLAQLCVVAAVGHMAFGLVFKLVFFKELVHAI